MELNQDFKEFVQLLNAGNFLPGVYSIQEGVFNSL